MPKNRSANTLHSLVFLLLLCGIFLSRSHGQTYTAYFSAINTTPAEEEIPLFPDAIEEEREEPRRLISFFTPTSSIQPYAFLTWVPPSPLLIMQWRPVPYWPVRSPLDEPQEPLPPEPEPIVGDISFEIDGEATFRVTQGGTGLNYRVAVDQIRNVIAVELQLVPIADETEEELIVADLLSGANISSGIIRGVIARGTLRSRDLIGPLSGQDIQELIGEIESGNVSLIIYTGDHRFQPLRGRLY